LPLLIYIVPLFLKLHTFIVENPMCVARQSSAFHSVMHHPVESNFILTANSKEGVALWDLRKPRK